MDLTHETTLKINSTKIIIPAYTILDEDGNKLKSAKLIYREIHDQAEIMSAGISMDIAGDSGNFLLETAGIIEIKSENPGMIIGEPGIRIEASTEENIENHNWYVLDDEQKWKNLGPASFTSELTPTREYNEPALVAAGALRKRWVVAAPIAHKEGRPTFKVVEPDVRELAIYKDYVFEVLPGQNYNENDIPDNWDEISITKSSVVGVYQLTLRNPGQVLKYKAIPVFMDKKAYQKALIAYNEYYSMDRIVTMDTASSEGNVLNRNTVDSALPRRIGSKMKPFIIRKFGMYNIAKRLAGLSSGRSFGFDVTGDQMPAKPVLYHYILDKKAVNKLLVSDNKTTMTFSKENKNILVLIYPQSRRMAVLDPEQFIRQIIYERLTTVSFTPVDRTFNNANEIQEYIETRYGGPYF